VETEQIDTEGRNTSHGAPVRPDTAHPVTWHPEVLNGPLGTRSLLRLEEALRQAEAATGLTFSVYVGPLTEPVRADAEGMHARLADPERSILVAISPNQRLLEIVTGTVARRRVLDRDAKLAALSMSAAFAGGDLGGGIVAGIAQLADHAGRS
jgi:uncharacterized membrane protein YgcG